MVNVTDCLRIINKSGNYGVVHPSAAKHQLQTVICVPHREQQEETKGRGS